MDAFFASVLQDSEFVLRLLIAGICGLLIGAERENRMKDAGIRTHLLVAVASALMMVISKYGFADVLNTMGDAVKLDPSRVASGIVTGIGFIGAGTIFVRKQAVSGLTTAAGLWATVGVGMAMGAGMYYIGIVTTLLILLIQFILHKKIRFFHNAQQTILLHTLNQPGMIAAVNTLLTEKGIKVLHIKSELNNHNELELEMTVTLPADFSPIELSAYLQQNPGILAMEF